MLIAQHAVLIGFPHRIGIPRSSLYFDQLFSVLAPVIWINVKHFTGPRLCQFCFYTVGLILQRRQDALSAICLCSCPFYHISHTGLIIMHLTFYTVIRTYKTSIKRGLQKLWSLYKPWFVLLVWCLWFHVWLKFIL